MAKKWNVADVRPDGTVDPEALIKRQRKEEVSAECSSHGIYSSGRCYCVDGWRGAACQLRACPNECSSHGICRGGECQCSKGYEGDDCSERSCPNKCSGHGSCRKGECSCEEGYGGTDCSRHHCPHVRDKTRPDRRPFRCHGLCFITASLTTTVAPPAPCFGRVAPATERVHTACACAFPAGVVKAATSHSVRTRALDAARAMAASARVSAATEVPIVLCLDRPSRFALSLPTTAPLQSSHRLLWRTPRSAATPAAEGRGRATASVASASARWATLASIAARRSPQRGV